MEKKNIMSDKMETGVSVEGAVATGAETPVSTRKPVSAAPDTEVLVMKKRKRYTARYKLKILKESQSLPAGQIGALLRREGLYSSYLTNWERQRKNGELDGLSEQKRGRKEDPDKGVKKRIAELEKENARLKCQLKKSELIIDVQKKISQMWGIELESQKNDENQ